MAEALTKARVAKWVAAGVPVGKTEAWLWDGLVSGLGLRMRPSGSVSWAFVYRPGGGGRGVPSRKDTLGDWPTLQPDAARAAARILAGKVAAGADPAAEKQASKARERRVLSASLAAFEASLTRRQIVNAKTILSTLRRGLAPYMGREIGTLTRAEFVKRIDALDAAGKPGAAADLRKHCRTLCEWAVSQGRASHNVMAGLRLPKASRAERLEDEQKGRALTDVEMRALWVAAPDLGSFGGLVRLAVLTGFRRSELSGLKWSDVHDDRIVIAAERAKTGAAHSVPLTVLMRTVLSSQPRTSSPLIFPGRSGARMAGWSKLVPRARQASGVVFGLHDLRRTCRTLMSRLGVTEEIAELAIGHVRRGLVGTYNKDQAWAARADAFERVSAHITGIVGASDGASVVALPARART